MPASNAKAIEKARTLSCDVVVLDLEDSVAPDAKEAARAQALEALRVGGFGRRELVIRVNGIDTQWGADDLAAAAVSGADAVLVPKVSDAADVERYDAALAGAPASLRLWAMIETTRSIFRLEEIAAASRNGRLAAWVIGTNDLAKEMGATLNAARAPFLGMLGLSVAAARAYGLAILDGVYNDIEDAEGFAAQCSQALEFGFDGKTLIPPKQIEPCNAIFSPSEAAIAEARAIIDAFALTENASKGAIRVNGRMVERLHLFQAERTLAIAEAVAGG
jgi:citrate lyase subunit beta/citryl-CoA lyase